VKPRVSNAWAVASALHAISTPYSTSVSFPLYAITARGQLPRHIVRQFQSPYTPSPRGLSRISARQVALALASRFSRMLSFQIKDMEFTGAVSWHSTSSNQGFIFWSNKISNPKISKQTLGLLESDPGRHNRYEWRTWGCETINVLMMISWKTEITYNTTSIFWWWYHEKHKLHTTQHQYFDDDILKDRNYIQHMQHQCFDDDILKDRNYIQHNINILMMISWKTQITYNTTSIFWWWYLERQIDR
jgi:hypothetical protein